MKARRTMTNLITPERELRAYLRQDLSCFVEKAFKTLEPSTTYAPNWHIDHLCWHLSRVAAGECTRLIINVPPRSMKSITASIAFPAWLLGHDPSKRIMCVSFSDDFARKLSVDTRTLLQTDWYQRTFPRMRLASKRPRNTELTTTEHGYRFAAGNGGSVLGRGADLIIVDDPIKPTATLSSAERRRVNEFYDNTLYTRLNNKQTGAIVIIMQRLHQDDLVGHVLPKDDWEVVSIPAIETETRSYRLGSAPDHVYWRLAGEVLHEAREPLETLERTRRSQGSLTFSAQYQQSPVPPEGNIVKLDWIQRYQRLPDAFDFKIASWDTASTLSENADYSVGTVWGAKGLDFYLIDLVRGRFEVPELRRHVVDLEHRWETHQTIIEDTELGRAIVQDLRRTGECRPILKKPKFDKEARFLAQSARFESRQVHAPLDAPWLADWLDELLAFPNGKHDDQVDSTSQALSYLSSRAFARNRNQAPKLLPPAGKRPIGHDFYRRGRAK